PLTCRDSPISMPDCRTCGPSRDPARVATASTHRTIRTREHDGVTIRIAQPAFPMVRPTAAIGRIPMARHDDFGLQFLCAGARGVDVVDLEPQQDAVAMTLDVGITDRTVVVFNVPPVQLEDQSPVPDQAFVLRATMIAPAAQQSLV